MILWIIIIIWAFIVAERGDRPKAWKILWMGTLAILVINILLWLA